jgi:hypothetical protein
MGRADQFDGVVKAIGVGLPIGRACRRIAANASSRAMPRSHAGNAAGSFKVLILR